MYTLKHFWNILIATNVDQNLHEIKLNKDLLFHTNLHTIFKPAIRPWKIMLFSVTKASIIAAGGD